MICAGQENTHVLAYATQLGCVLLEPSEGRIESPGPARGHVVVGFLGAPHVVPLHLHVDRHHVDAIEEGNFIGRAERAPFGTGAIVAVDVNDKGILKLADVFDCLDDSADFVIVIGCIGGENLDLTDEEFFLFGRAIVPVFDDVRWPRFELGVWRNHSQTLLVLKDSFPEFIPAVIATDAWRGFCRPTPWSDDVARGWPREHI